MHPCIPAYVPRTRSFRQSAEPGRRPPSDRETQDPPPIPDDIKYERCYFGFEISDSDIDRYDKAHDIAPPQTPFDIRWHKQAAVGQHAKALGIRHVTIFSSTLERSMSRPKSSKEDFVWFVCSRGWNSIMTGCPTTAKIDALREALGIQESARWLVV